MCIVRREMIGGKLNGLFFEVENLLIQKIIRQNRVTVYIYIRFECHQSSSKGSCTFSNCCSTILVIMQYHSVIKVGSILI